MGRSRDPDGSWSVGRHGDGGYPWQGSTLQAGDYIRVGIISDCHHSSLVEFNEGRGFEQGRQKKRNADKSTVLTVSLLPTKSLDEMCRRCVPQRQTPVQGASDHGEGGRNLGTLDEIR